MMMMMTMTMTTTYSAEKVSEKTVIVLGVRVRIIECFLSYTPGLKQGFYFKQPTNRRLASFHRIFYYERFVCFSFIFRRPAPATHSLSCTENTAVKIGVNLKWSVLKQFPYLKQYNLVRHSTRCCIEHTEMYAYISLRP